MSAHAPGVVLSVRDLCIDYVAEHTVHAVKNATFDLSRGEILGLAGESGCGKSTLVYGVCQLLKPPALITRGSATFHGSDGAEIDLLNLADEELRQFRWKRVAMVFQGAMNALNPVLKIGVQLGDVFTTHRPEMSGDDIEKATGELLERVGVPRNRLMSYPHELSGGMRQRVMIAMAMALDPEILIMDEPTTALDVLVQRDILREITRLREEVGFAVIFITHDLPLLLEISDRIAIMRAGEILELEEAYQLYTQPKNDYTRRLLASFPSLTGEQGDFIRGGLNEQLLEMDAVSEDSRSVDPPIDKDTQDKYSTQMGGGA